MLLGHLASGGGVDGGTVRRGSRAGEAGVLFFLIWWLVASQSTLSLFKCFKVLHYVSDLLHIVWFTSQLFLILWESGIFFFFLT